MAVEPYSQLPSYVPSLDGSSSGYVTAAQRSGSGPVYNMGSVQVALPQPQTSRPQLSLLTDVGRKYPGFPTPLSPTPSAKALWPSPAIELGSGTKTPRPLSPAVRSVSPMSIDGSEMCGPSRRCNSHGYEHYAGNMGLIDSMIAPLSPPQSPRSPSMPVTPTSPTHPLSPRATMFKNMLGKHAFQSLSHDPVHFPISTLRPSDPASSPGNSYRPTLDLSIEIANGTETSTLSPISPSGTILAYTSHRPVDSGLLGVRPLSEAQVAEYRFWRPCGKRVCAFGCGGAHEGEYAAAKRLFREVEDVAEEAESGAFGGFDGGSESTVVDSERAAEEEEEYRASVWAGRRLVTNWNMFLRGLEREGVARF